MTEWMNGRSRPRLIASALLIVTFLVGGLTGAAANKVVNARPAAPAGNGTDPTPHRSGEADRNSDRRDRSPYDNLDLTPEQRTRVDALLAERHRRIDSIWEQNEPAMRAIMASTRQEIEALLTDEQRTQLEQRRAHWRERRTQEAQPKHEER